MSIVLGKIAYMRYTTYFIVNFDSRNKQDYYMVTASECITPVLTLNRVRRKWIRAKMRFVRSYHRDVIRLLTLTCPGYIHNTLFSIEVFLNRRIQFVTTSDSSIPRTSFSRYLLRISLPLLKVSASFVSLMCERPVFSMTL